MATADAIELACPGCRERLEIDAGFAGGVCRCYNCGTLMTVPDDPAAGGKAERLARPDRPGSPGGGRPETPTEAGKRPETPGAGAGAGAGATVEAEAETVDLSSEEVFVTESGRTIRVSRHQVPVAQRRRVVVRGTVVLLFLGIVGGVLVATVVAIGLILGGVKPSSPPASDGDGPAVQTRLLADPGNPFMAEPGTFMGLRLEPPVVLLVDRSARAESWLPLVNDVILQTVRRLEGAPPIQVVCWSASETKRFPEAGPGPIEGLVLDNLEKLLGDLWPEGLPARPEVLAEILEQDPRHIVIVSGLSEERLEPAWITEQLEAHGEPVLLDVVAVGREPAPGLRELAERFEGHAVSVGVLALQRAYRQWQASGEP